MDKKNVDFIVLLRKLCQLSGIVTINQADILGT